MEEQDKTQLASLLVLVASNYRIVLDDGTAKTWMVLLKEYSIEEVGTAVWRHIKNTERGNFPPTIADIIRLIDGSAGTRATEAWNRAMSAMCTHGTNATVAFDDPGIHYAITEMGGWIEFGYWDNSETPFKQKRFEDLYRAYTAAPRGGCYVELEGRANAENRGGGLEKGFYGGKEINFIEPTVFIGDGEKIKWLLSGPATVRGGVDVNNFLKGR